jgi:K+-transporting ATPase ATPase C chain
MYVRQIKISILSIVVLSLLTGLLYPLVITAITQTFFPHQANGSLIMKDGKPIGSVLIGQPFDDPRYFWGRLSATNPMPFNAASSSGSNYGPLNPALVKAAQERIRALKEVDPASTAPIPVDLVTSSASGLDPHISPAAALYQVPRIARTRGLPEDAVRQIVQKHTEERWMGILGERRVSVLLLNLELDELSNSRKESLF